MSRTLCPDCNASRGLAEYDNGTYCHACQMKSFKHSLIPRPRSRYVASLTELESSLVPVTHNKKAVEYLNQYYINGWELELDTFQYSTLLDRLVIPRWDEMNKYKLLSAWCRSLKPDDNLKWLYLGDPLFKHFKFDYNTPGFLYITEDVISAYRVSRSLNTNVVTLAGTHLTDIVKSECLYHRTIVVWLDGDIAGIKGAEKIKRELGLYKNIKIIRTKRDPKTFTNAEIQEIIND